MGGPTSLFSVMAFGIGSTVLMATSTHINSALLPIFMFPPISRAMDVQN